MKNRVLEDAGLLVGTDRDADRLRLIKHALNHPEGALLPEIWRDVFGRTGPVDPADRDYQFIRRFYTANPSLFQLTDKMA